MDSSVPQLGDLMIAHFLWVQFYFDDDWCDFLKPPQLKDEPDTNC